MSKRNQQAPQPVAPAQEKQQTTAPATETTSGGAQQEESDPEAGADPSTTESDAVGVGGDTTPATDQPPSTEQQSEPVETVKALVLSDSIYGKCGEVKDFPAAQVEAIAAAGFIDPHPNAVKSVEG